MARTSNAIGYNRTKRVDWNIEDPGNFWYTDDRRAGKWLKCWSYDLNSAFSYAMTKPMPDTSKEPRLRDLVQENEIGFYSDGGATTKVGAYAEYIFPLMPSPFTKYVENYYNKKQKAKDKNERNCWKSFLIYLLVCFIEKISSCEMQYYIMLSNILNNI